jgi:hypothetical protein
MGGATNHMLIEAVKSLSPGGPGSQTSTPDTSGRTPAGQASAAEFEIPLFIQGSVWPELPFLPKPEQLSRPPKYVADLLVKLYFDQLHYTFPVLFKPHFMQKYRQMFRPNSDANSATERRFLMVFYAVCACASGLLPGSADSKFPGLEHYEKALLLCFAANGEASLERVQCLALLAMCSAGWNTLTQSWTLVGQAVRAAQDIGLHLSRRMVSLACRTLCCWLSSLFELDVDSEFPRLCPRPLSRKLQVGLMSCGNKLLDVSGGVFMVLIGTTVPSLCLIHPVLVDMCDG